MSLGCSSTHSLAEWKAFLLFPCLIIIMLYINICRLQTASIITYMCCTLLWKSVFVYSNLLQNQISSAPKIAPKSLWALPSLRSASHAQSHAVKRLSVIHVLLSKDAFALLNQRSHLLLPTIYVCSLRSHPYMHSKQNWQTHPANFSLISCTALYIQYLFLFDSICQKNFRLREKWSELWVECLCAVSTSLSLVFPVL